MQIRPASVEDCQALGRIIIDATRDAFRGRVPDRCLHWLTPEESAANWARTFEPGQHLDQGAHLLVAEDERSGVIGLAMVGETTSSRVRDQSVAEQYPYDLHSLQVDPLWQRRGVGRRLVSGVADVLSNEGASHLLIRVLGDNPNRTFYERLGAVRIGSQPYDWEGYKTEEILYGWDDIRKLCLTV